MTDINLEQLKAEDWRFYLKKIGDKKYMIGQRTLSGSKKRESMSLGRKDKKPELWKQLEDAGLTSTKNVKVHVPIEDPAKTRSLTDLQKKVDAANRTIEKQFKTIEKQSSQLKKKSVLIEKLQQKIRIAKKLKEGRGSSYTLSKSQFNRLSGISHLDGGKRPVIIIDELLTMELKFRKYKISFADFRRIKKLLDEAIHKKWTPKELVSCMTKLWNQDIHILPPKTVAKLVELVKIVQERKWKLDNFVTFATTYYNQMYWSKKYDRGEISKDQFMREMKVYV